MSDRAFSWGLLLCLSLTPGCEGEEPRNNNGGGDADTDADTDSDTDADTDADPECTSHNQCSSDQFCYQQECLDAVGREYRVVVHDLSVGTTDPDGQYWDVFGGAPDLFVEFGYPNDFATTSEGLDSFQETWNEYDIFVLNGGEFRFDVYESDAASADWYVGWVYQGADDVVSLARSNGQRFELTDNSGTITLGVSVRYPAN